MLKNGSFEGGWRQWDPSNQEPKHWTYEVFEGVPCAGGETEFPELVHKSVDELPKKDWHFIRGGDWCLKLFAGGRPFSARLYQVVDGLVPGEAYEFSIHVYNDTFDWEGKKVAPSDNDLEEDRAASIRLFASTPGGYVSDDGCGEWFDERNFPGYDGDYTKWYLAHHDLTYKFVAVSEEMEIGFEVWHPWGIANNGWFIDDAKLELIGEPEDPPSPSGPYEYPVVERGSKVGTHNIYANNTVNFARELAGSGAGFSVIKAVDDFGWLEGYNGDAVVVGRKTWPGGEGCGNIFEIDLNDHALKAIDRILHKISEQPTLRDVVDYWEPYNEPDPPGAEGYTKLSELMIATMDIAENHGLKIALFSLNAGTPEWDEMVAMVDSGVFERANEGGHILSLHEGTFETHDPKQYWGDTIPGSPAVDGAGSLNFRYRYLYSLIDDPIPLVVTEWYCGDEQSASVSTLLDAIKWYDGEASKDHYMLGFCPFTLGPCSGWHHTDYERVYEGGLLDYIVDVKERENVAPEEKKEYQGPRVDYTRIYNVFHQDYTGQDAEEQALELLEKGQTIGRSFDDAGIGDLSNKKAVLHGIPVEDRDSYTDFYDEYYPTVSVEFADYEEEASSDWDDYLMAQGDPEWGNHVYADGRCYTLRGQGCFISCCAMAMRILGIDEGATPLSVDQTLGSGGYSDRCMLLHSAMREDLGLDIDYVGHPFQARQWMDEGNIVFIEVAPSSLMHFVVGVEYNDEGDFLVLDPWKNKVDWLSNLYEGAESFRLIKPIEQPPF